MIVGIGGIIHHSYKKKACTPTKVENIARIIKKMVNYWQKH